MELFFWVVMGVVAGWIARMGMLSQGRDRILDIVLGIVGAIGGGFLLTAAHPSAEGRMIYTSLAAILGAISLTVLSRYLTAKLAYDSSR